MMVSFKLESIGILTMALLLAACGVEEPGGGFSVTGAYRPHLVFPEDIPRPEDGAKALNGFRCGEKGVTTIEFNFILNGHQYSSRPFDCEDHHASISGVPAGEGVLVEVSADNANGEAVYEGFEMTDIKPDQVNPGGEIQMNPVDSPTDSNPDTNAANFTNDFGMEFVRIPAANRTFTMGSPTEELGHDDDETEHQVTLSADYYMQTTEVTQGQWRAVIIAAQNAGIAATINLNPSHFSNCGESCPVENVSWYTVQEFLNVLNQIDQRTYTLPTEAQWEYAARGNTKGALPNGELRVTDCSFPPDPILNAIAWYCGNSEVTTYSDCYTAIADDRCRGTHPVGLKVPNSYNLYDMHGNVQELCSDRYSEHPSGGLDPQGPSSGNARVIRGGSWYHHARYCRSAERSGLAQDAPGNASFFIGFRLAVVQ